MTKDVRPFYGWAPLAPDGCLMGTYVCWCAEQARLQAVKIQNVRNIRNPKGWRQCYRMGWRVIRVSVEPAFKR